jgi:hypothetical protein
MKAKGIKLDWYERVKASKREALGGGNIAPLDDKECSSSSIYIWLKNGELWTLNNRQPHRIVRPASRKPESDTYICVCCKKSFKNLEDANSHFIT